MSIESIGRSVGQDDIHDPSEEWKEYFRIRRGKEALLKPKDIDADDLAMRAQAGRDARAQMDLLTDDGTPDVRQKIQDLQKIIAEGEQAKNDLFEANIGLVLKYANKYRGRGVAFADLVQEANLGLMHAINTYDVNKPGKFGTWATGKILQYVIRSFYTQSYQGAVKQKDAEQLSKLKNVRKQLAQDLGRVPTIDELAEAMNKDTNETRILVYYGNDHVSLDRSISNDGAALGEILSDKHANDPGTILAEASLRQELDKLLADLSPEGQIVLKGMYGLEGDEIKNLPQLQKQLKLSYAAIRAIHDEGIDRLRSRADRYGLKEYLYE